LFARRDKKLNETTHVSELYKFLRTVFVLSISAAAVLVAFSLYLPIYELTITGTSGLSPDDLSNGTFTAILKDVLPFATALVGFAAGLASSVFGVTTRGETSTKPQPSVVTAMENEMDTKAATTGGSLTPADAKAVAKKFMMSTA
jgi:hypothetical protein